MTAKLMLRSANLYILKMAALLVAKLVLLAMEVLLAVSASDESLFKWRVINFLLQ